MASMFYNAEVFDQLIQTWDTTKVASYADMFTQADAMIATYSGTPGFGTTPTDVFFSSIVPTLTLTFTAVPLGQVLTIPLTAGSGLTAFDTISWNGGTPLPISETSNHSYTSTEAGAKIIAVISVRIGSIERFGGTWSGAAFLLSAVSADDTASTTWGLGDSVTSLEDAFNGCVKLTQVPEYLPTSVTTLKGTFQGCAAITQSLSSWATTNVTDMSNMFNGASSFNANISSWVTSSVADMSNMFNGATLFNQNIGGWNTSSVTNLSSMFQSAVVFNQNITNWDTTLVTDPNNYDNMFQGATAMLSEYSQYSFFGATPTSVFFNMSETLTITWTGVNTGAKVEFPVYSGVSLSINDTITWTDGDSVRINRASTNKTQLYKTGYRYFHPYCDIEGGRWILYCIWRCLRSPHFQLWLLGIN